MNNDEQSMWLSDSECGTVFIIIKMLSYIITTVLCVYSYTELSA